MQSYKLLCNCKISPADYDKLAIGEIYTCDPHGEMTAKQEMKPLKIRGRKKGIPPTKPKFTIEWLDVIKKEWQALGTFPTLKEASKQLNIDYEILTDMNIGRRKVYRNFYRIIKI
jgi:hypothetical protein